MEFSSVWAVGNHASLDSVEIPAKMMESNVSKVFMKRPCCSHSSLKGYQRFADGPIVKTN
jgi:hypothetical protein